MALTTSRYLNFFAPSAVHKTSWEVRLGISINHSDVNNALVCCLQTPQTHKSAIKISVPAESSHTIGSLMAGDQTKEARLPKVSQTS